MQINTYLNFNGNCEAAFKFYEKCLGGKILMMMTHAESPMAEQTPPEQQQAIMHARMEVAGQLLMGSDGPTGQKSTAGGFSLNIGVDSVAEAERIYGLLSEGGTVHMALQKTFWAERFSMFVDRFGTPWMINCENPA